MERTVSYEGLTFDRVIEVSNERLGRWHGPGSEWSAADWSNAMCGEVGELVEALDDLKDGLVIASGKAANNVKKFRRTETGTVGLTDPDVETLRGMLAHEIADVIFYAFLLASHCKIDVPTALVDKFNIVSERQGFPDRLP